MLEVFQTKSTYVQQNLSFFSVENTCICPLKMSVTHEIVTIQAGKFSNFIGAHWWNIQESSFCYSPDSSVPLDINHDVTFREGLNLKGEVTYTPRLVLIDLQDNFKSLRRESALYRNEDTSHDAHWEGPLDIIKKDPVKRNPFLEEQNAIINSENGELEQGASAEISNFDDPSTAWTDFLKTYLHPNSICLLNEFFSSDDTDPLQMYSNGEELYLKVGETIEESIRKMTEECDYLQGFQMIFDAHDGFSGISSQILQYLDEEYKRRPSLCFPVYQTDNFPICDAKKQMQRLYAILSSLSNMNSHCTCFSPLSLTDDIVKLSHPYTEFPYIQYNEKLLFHSSAILAAGIETLSSPFRLRSMKHNMFDVVSSMTTYGRKLVCSSVSLPFPLSHDAYLSVMIEKDISQYYMVPLSPYYKPNAEQTLFQSAVLRGVPSNKFQNPNKCCQPMKSEEVFGQYLNKYSPSSLTIATVFNENCSVSCPFPSFFKDIVSNCGILNSNNHIKQNRVDKIPIAASFSSSDSSSKFLENLIVQSKKFSFREYAKNSEATFEKDGYTEMIENLIGLQDNYTNY